MSSSCGIPPRSLRLAGPPFCRALPLDGDGVACCSSVEKNFQTLQSAIEANPALILLLPGIRSNLGNKNNASPVISAFADQIPAQTGTNPWRARPTPMV